LHAQLAAEEASISSGAVIATQDPPGLGRPYKAQGPQLLISRITCGDPAMEEAVALAV